MDDPNNFMDIDDLFNDEPSAISQPALPQPTLPPPQRASVDLLNRLDAKSHSGCCQKVAWSRMGCIVSVSPDDVNSVTAHVVMHDPKKKQSVLDSIKPMTLPFRSSSEIAHLTFSPSGTELAIVDRQGGVSIHSMLVCLQRLQQASHHDCPSSDGSGEVIGFQWCDKFALMNLFTGAVRKPDGTYDYPSQPFKPRPPYHPEINKSAALILSRSGTLRLVYMQHAMGFQFVRAELDSNDASENFFTHATMIQYRDAMLLVTSDTERLFRLFLVGIQWRTQIPPQGSNPQNPRMQQRPARMNPYLDIRPLRDFSGLIPESLGSTTKITHFNMISDHPNPSATPGIPNTLVAVLAVQDTTSGEIHSRVLRWQLSEAQDTASSAWQQIGKPKANKAENLLELKALPSVDIQGVVVSAQYPEWPSPFIFARHDGAVEYRDRVTLEPYPQDLNAPVIQNLAQCGVKFAIDTPINHIAFSPNQCMAVTCKTLDEPLHLRMVECPEETLTQHKPALVALYAYTFTSSFGSHHSNDDIFALFERDGAKMGISALLLEAYKALNIDLDLRLSTDAGDHAVKVIMNSPLQRCLSFQQALGVRTNSLAIPGKVARIVLNARHALLCLRIGVLSPAQHHDRLVDVPETLIGMVVFLSTLFTYIISELQQLAHRAPQPLTAEWAKAEATRTYSPVLALILGATSRFFLKYSVQHLREAQTKVRTAVNTTGIRFKQSWTLLLQSTGCPVNLKAFETLLMEMDHQTHKACAEGSNATGAAKQDLEREMLAQGSIPSVLDGCVLRLLGPSLDKVLEAEQSNPIAIWERDPSILGLAAHDPPGTERSRYDESPPSDSLLAFPRVLPREREERLDALRKVSMQRELKEWKRCSRCDAVTEDLPAKPGVGVPLWLVSMQKCCLCGTPFVLDRVDAEEHAW